MISAETQARLEGYFRLEWRLADQRSHLTARGKPFLLPVTIDDTRDTNAQVPDSFLEVQWTQLPNGETSVAFSERVPELFGKADATVAMLSADLAAGIQHGDKLRNDPDFALVRAGPRFQERMRQAEAWAAAQPEPDDP